MYIIKGKINKNNNLKGDEDDNYIKNNILPNYAIDKPNKLFLFKKDKTKAENKQKIRIAMALDNYIIYQALVSMASAWTNNNENKNILVYYLLLSSNFNKANIEIFESLKLNFTVKINYYIIPQRFSDLESGKGLKW